MRRRRQKNTLLPKMLGIAVLVNAILLPILAQMGVFKTVEQRLQPVTLVNLPPPEKKPPPPPPKRKPPRKTVKAKPRPQAKTAARQNVSHAPRVNQPHVVASAAPAGSGAAGSTIDNSGTGTAGQVPVPETAPPPTPPAPEPPPPVVTPPAPQAPPPAPHVPTLVAARALSQPRPEMPDDLRSDALHAVLRGVFAVHADGTASFRVTQGTGSSELDKLATDYARRWTFQPATEDGTPVDSFLRVEMRFDVDA